MSYHDTRGPRRNETRNRGDNRWPERRDRPKLEEAVVAQHVIEGPRKTITISRRRNSNGDFLRIDEVRPGQDRGSIVIIPSESIEELLYHADQLFPETPLQEGATTGEASLTP